MNIFIQRTFSALETKSAELGAVFVLMKHVHPIFFGDPKTAAMKVLGLT